MSDPNEWLKERRRIHAKGSTGYWASDEKNWDEPYDTTLVYDVFHNGDTMDRDHVADASYDNAEVIVDAHNTLPALLTAVEKVLELHKPDTVYAWAEECTDPGRHEAFTDIRSGDMLCEDEPIGRFCAECVPENDTTIDVDEYPWPCPTVRAIEGAVK